MIVHTTTKPSTTIMVFDSPVLTTQEQLQNTIHVIQSTLTNNIKIIALCGAYSNTHTKLCTIANTAIHEPLETTETALQSLFHTFHEPLNQAIAHERQHQYTQILDTITQCEKDLHALLKGISYVKELSSRTLSLLSNYASHLSTLLLQALLTHVCDKSTTIVLQQAQDMTSEYLNVNDITLIPVSSISHKIDHVAAKIVLDLQIPQVAIWSDTCGVMTADPEIVPTAFSLTSIDYATALEISYLGGKIFHPTPLSLLMEKNVSIAIYAHSHSNPATIIANTIDVPHKKCIAITHRNNFSMLTVRTTNMVNTYGYLEKLFHVFNTLKISIETVTTSEISVTVTLLTQSASPALFDALTTLGDIEYKDNQSIISLIGKECLNQPRYLAEIINTLDDEITIGMLSLGQIGTNLSVVVATALMPQTMNRLHAHLFTNTTITKAHC